MVGEGLNDAGVWPDCQDNGCRGPFPRSGFEARAEALDDLRPREHLLDKPPAGETHAARAGRIIDQDFEAFNDVVDGVNDVSGLAGNHRLGRTTRVSCEDGESRSSRFEEDEAEALDLEPSPSRLAGHAEDIHRAIEVGKVDPWDIDGEPGLYAEIVCLPAEIRLLPPSADEQHLDRTIEEGRGLQQAMLTLARYETRDTSNDGHLVVPVRWRRERLNIDTCSDEDDVLAGEPLDPVRGEPAHSEAHIRVAQRFGNGLPGSREGCWERHLRAVAEHPVWRAEPFAQTGSEVREGMGSAK